MKVIFYIGDHASDDWLTRLGWWATRLVQKGTYWRVTHVEAILAENADGTVDIASASIREGGVRIKKGVRLNPEHWLVAETPWNKQTAAKWFKAHAGEKYDALGAFASCVPIQWSQPNKWFCNQAVGASAGLVEPQVFGPSQFAAIVFTIGYDVTQQFFESRK